METPLERVPPGRAVSSVPFGVGDWAALAGAAGGGADIGASGSTFRLLENICIGLGSPSKSSWDSYSQRSTVSADTRRHEVDHCAGEAENRGPDEVRAGPQFPEPCAKNRTGADEKITHQIVSADHLTAPLRRAITDDERLPRGVAEFFQSANREGGNEHREAPR